MQHKVGSLTFIQEGQDILLVNVIVERKEKLWNGVETIIQSGQSLERQTVKELYAQLKVSAYPEDLQNVGTLTVRTLNHQGLPFSDLTLTLFSLRQWQNEPQITPGVKPRWFQDDEIPYQDTIDHFQYWLPDLVEGKRVFVEIVYRENLEKKVTELADVIVR